MNEQFEKMQAALREAHEIKQRALRIVYMQVEMNKLITEMHHYIHRYDEALKGL